MKHLKIVIALFISTAIIFSSCKPKEDKSGGTVVVTPEKPKVSKKEIAFEDISKVLGSEIASKLMSNDATAKGKPAKAVIVVWFNDLSLTPIAGGYNVTLPPNVTWAGVQSLSSISSLCNWYLAGQSLTNKDCMTDSTVQIRGWATDTDYNVHVSNVIN